MPGDLRCCLIVAFMMSFLGSVLALSSTIHAPTDGSEASTAIQEAVLAAKPGSTLILPAGRYHCEWTINITSVTSVLILGEAGAETYQLYPGPLVRGSSHRAMFALSNCTDVTVSGIVTTGPNTASTEPGHKGYGVYNATLYAEHAFSILYSSRISILHCNVRAPHGDGVYVGGRSTDIAIVNVTVYLNGRQGMSVCDASNVTILDSNISRSGRSGIDLEPDGAGWVVQNVTISNTILDCHLLAFPSIGAGLVSDIVIENNVISHCASPWLEMRGSVERRRSNWKVTGNTVNFKTGAVSFGFVSGVVFRENLMSVVHKRGRLWVSVHFDNVDGAEVIDNFLEGSCDPPYSEVNSTHIIAYGNNGTIPC